MNIERKKALLIVAGTFVIGIVIGVLATGLFARNFYHKHEDAKRVEQLSIRDKRGLLAKRIFNAVNADSSQQKLMEPIIEKTLSHIDTLQKHGEHDARLALDSLKMKFQNILRPGQIDSLQASVLRLPIRAGLGHVGATGKDNVKSEDHKHDDKHHHKRH